MAESLRTFLAIELSDRMKGEIGPLVKTIKEDFQNFRFLPPQNWHLTLHFLGEQGPETIEKLESQLPSALSGIQPFTIFLEGAGGFPEGQQPRILWVGIGGEIPKLLMLKKALDLVLRNLHLRIEARVYHPHITVARFKSSLRSAVVDLSARLDPHFKGQVTDVVTSITLLKSVLSTEGAQYTPLKRFSFGNL